MDSWKNRFSQNKRFNTEESDALLAMLKQNRDKVVEALKDESIKSELNATDQEIEEAADKILRRDEDDPA